MEGSRFIASGYKITRSHEKISVCPAKIMRSLAGGYAIANRPK
ncbi:hypothetical protein [Nostoc sp. LPT]|nr:hypothetical protein [Nostoc sp. LPT]